MLPLYAVFGHPIAHSRSPDIHALFAAQEGVAVRYERRLVEGSLHDALLPFAAAGGSGANVTVPCKEEAFHLCAERSVRAEQAGAVNTLIRLPENAWRGDNTDGIGLVNDITRLGVSLRGAKVLLLGAGGAVRGVLGPILAENPAAVTVANRTAAKAHTLAALFDVQAALFSELAGTRFDVVINGTSASLAGENLPLPSNIFEQAKLAYDMMYAPQDTPFLRQARGGGAQHCADGLGMLVGQAAASYALWRGFEPELEPVLHTMRERLRHA
ncbi:MAG: shikimate dehydrogenase [Neisseria sp.]|nr:shikimate dehydrogenase [Neisseria sp.]